MSGDQLRNFAIVGSFDQLKYIVSRGGNPCSTDAKGLTALHYAVWNRHTSCVHLLIANDRGVLENGLFGSCINIQSSVGYTALHIAINEYTKYLCKHYLKIDEDEKLKMEECIRLLLMSRNINFNLKDYKGKTPIDTAFSYTNKLPKYISDIYESRIRQTTPQMNQLYTELFVPWIVQRRKDLLSTESFAVREQSQQNEEFPVLEEDEIYDFAKSNFKVNHRCGVEVIYNLNLALKQAKKNVERRANLGKMD